MNPRIFYIIYALYCFFLHLLIYCYYNYTKPPLPIIKELKTMQKQSFQRFPIRYRPYDFPSRFPVLAFLGDNWTISVNSPEYLHFHNGLEIGHCISGNGQLFLAGQAPVPVSYTHLYRTSLCQHDAYHRLVSFTFRLTVLARISRTKLMMELKNPTAAAKLYSKFIRPIR